ncbi:hypothetical protein LWI29_026608 [Acer saccharum]|uniref:Uncharacterized protein n=1 Tax=Acer saccharum TaxID=4024 RepID=A0AA39SF02_ACESA|nr:hypothetical protein LWI29_026608 [Acer saccharum]
MSRILLVGLHELALTSCHELGNPVHMSVNRLFFLDFRIVTDLPKILYVVNLACMASSSYSLHEVALVSCHELGDPVHVSVNKSVT